MFFSCICQVLLMYHMNTTWQIHEHYIRKCLLCSSDIHEIYMRYTWDIHEVYIDFSSPFIKYMRDTWQIHEIYMRNTWEIHVFTHVFLMYFSCISGISSDFYHKKYMRNTWEIHEKYIEIPVPNPISHVFCQIHEKCIWKINVFLDSEKYRKNTCISHVFLMYFSCIYKKLQKKALKYQCISHVFLMYLSCILDPIGKY